MSYLPFSSRAVEAGDALQSAKKAALPQALSTPPGGVERTILVRLLAVGNSPRSDAVRRGKRLVGKGPTRRPS